MRKKKCFSTDNFITLLFEIIHTLSPLNAPQKLIFYGPIFLGHHQKCFPRCQPSLPSFRLEASSFNVGRGKFILHSCADFNFSSFFALLLIFIGFAFGWKLNYVWSIKEGEKCSCSICDARSMA